MTSAPSTSTRRSRGDNQSLPGQHNMHDNTNGYNPGDGYSMPNPPGAPGGFPQQPGGPYGQGPGSQFSSNGPPRPPYMGPGMAPGMNMGSPRSGTRGTPFGGRPRQVDDDGTDFSDDSDSWDDEDDYPRRHRSGRNGGTSQRGHSTRQRSRGAPDTRRRSMDDSRHSGGAHFTDPWGHAPSDSESDNDDEQDPRSRRQRLTRNRSISRLRSKAHDLLNDSDDERTGNSQTKKWGATLAGALAGGLAAQQVGKRRRGGRGDTNWVPTAIGAFMGGFASREAEKIWYKRKADVEEKIGEHRDRYGGSREDGRGRSRSQGW